MCVYGRGRVAGSLFIWELVGRRETGRRDQEMWLALSPNFRALKHVSVRSVLRNLCLCMVLNWFPQHSPSSAACRETRAHPSY